MRSIVWRPAGKDNHAVPLEVQDRSGRAVDRGPPAGGPGVSYQQVGRSLRLDHEAEDAGGLGLATRSPGPSTSKRGAVSRRRYRKTGAGRCVAKKGRRRARAGRAVRGAQGSTRGRPRPAAVAPGAAATHGARVAGGEDAGLGHQHGLVEAQRGGHLEVQIEAGEEGLLQHRERPDLVVGPRRASRVVGGAVAGIEGEQAPPAARARPATCRVSGEGSKKAGETMGLSPAPARTRSAPSRRASARGRAARRQEAPGREQGQEPRREAQEAARPGVGRDRQEARVRGRATQLGREEARDQERASPRAAGRARGSRPRAPPRRAGEPVRARQGAPADGGCRGRGRRAGRRRDGR